MCVCVCVLKQTYKIQINVGIGRILVSLPHCCTLMVLLVHPGCISALRWFGGGGLGGCLGGSARVSVAAVDTYEQVTPQ